MNTARHDKKSASDDDAFKTQNDELADLSRLTDEELVSRIVENREPAQEELFNRYKHFVRSKARSYFLIGADREDIIQEGMIGLYKAMRDYNPEKQSSFRAFAELCVTRQMITAIKTATRQKHIPLNSYISLNKPVYDEESDRMLIDTLTSSRVASPEELLIGQEDYAHIEARMSEILSTFEWNVFTSYLSGKTYQEIAVEQNRETKSIDNALQRVKRKLEKFLLALKE